MSTIDELRRQLGGAEDVPDEVLAGFVAEVLAEEEEKEEGGGVQPAPDAGEQLAVLTGALSMSAGTSGEAESPEGEQAQEEQEEVEEREGHAGEEDEPESSDRRAAGVRQMQLRQEIVDAERAPRLHDGGAGDVSTLSMMPVFRIAQIPQAWEEPLNTSGAAAKAHNTSPQRRRPATAQHIEQQQQHQQYNVMNSSAVDLLSPAREYNDQRQPADPLAIAQRANAVVRAYDEATPPELRHAERKRISSSNRALPSTKSATSTARNPVGVRRKKRAVKGGARSAGTRGNLKGPPLRVLVDRSPRPSKRSPNKMAVLNDVSRLYKTPKQQRKPPSSQPVPSKNYKKKKKTKKKANHARKASPANQLRKQEREDDLNLQYQEEEFERLQAERWSLEQQYSALKRSIGMDDAEAMATMMATEMQEEAAETPSYFYHMDGSGNAVETNASAADMIMSSPSVQHRQQQQKPYEPYQPFQAPFDMNHHHLADGGVTRQQLTQHDEAFPIFADGHLEYPTMSGFEPAMAISSSQAGGVTANAMMGPGNGDEPAETMMTPRFRSRSGLSHDSDAWRRMSERRPRTAPPQGLDSESAVWSNQQQNAIFANQSYMVGEPTPRPQRGGQRNVSIFPLPSYLSGTIFPSACFASLPLAHRPRAPTFPLRSILTQARRKRHKTPMSDPVARYASHASAWKKNIFLNHGSNKRPYGAAQGRVVGSRRLRQSAARIGGDAGPASSGASIIRQSRTTSSSSRKMRAKFVVPTKKRRDDVRTSIHLKMKMVRTMAAQAGKRGGNRGASRAKTPNSFRIPSSKKRANLCWEVRAKMLSPA